jgi:hypothetical protein
MEYTIIIQGYSDELTEKETLDKAHLMGERAIKDGALHYKIVSVGSDLCWDSRE